MGKDCSTCIYLLRKDIGSTEQVCSQGHNVAFVENCHAHGERRKCWCWFQYDINARRKMLTLCNDISPTFPMWKFCPLCGETLI